MQPKYIFSKDKNGNEGTQVEMKLNDERIFCFWLHRNDKEPNETKSQTCDRIIQNAGYKNRLDFFNHWRKIT